MANEFLGRGWRFPILPDEAGSLRYCEGQENIEQSLKILLMTSLGERVMRATFGTEAPRLVFAPGSDRYQRALEQTIRVAIRDFEPRIEVMEVRAEAGSTGAGDGGSFPQGGAAGREEARITVAISYKIRRTNTRFNLVFPFYRGTVEAT